jgi:hypothetical protein
VVELEAQLENATQRTSEVEDELSMALSRVQEQVNDLTDQLDEKANNRYWTLASNSMSSVNVVCHLSKFMECIYIKIPAFVTVNLSLWYMYNKNLRLPNFVYIHPIYGYRKISCRGSCSSNNHVVNQRSR